MKVVQINAVCGVGSTGNICIALSDLLERQGIENYILYSSGNSSHPNALACGSKAYTRLQAVRSRILGNYGFNSISETKRIIAFLEKRKPDILQLHNIHGHDCHLELLTEYLKSRRTKVFWTFHDCWAFTGYCTHFTYAGCQKWRSGCGSCPQRSRYSLVLDRSAELARRKREALRGMDLTIITPSRWMAEMVRQSFLGEHPVRVVPNGIDLDIFQPTASSIREQYLIPKEKYILLGVAQKWDLRKGLDVFIELAHRLDSRHFQILLVGADPKIQQLLPKQILSIPPVRDPRKMAALYSAADLFLNPTREDTYPTVNLEALACGTPVLTFPTGGSPESITETTGCVLDRPQVDAMEREILRIWQQSPFSREDCRRSALAFQKERCFSLYLQLYAQSFPEAAPSPPNTAFYAQNPVRYH